MENTPATAIVRIVPIVEFIAFQLGHGGNRDSDTAENDSSNYRNYCQGTNNRSGGASKGAMLKPKPGVRRFLFRVGTSMPVDTINAFNA